MNLISKALDFMLNLAKIEKSKLSAITSSLIIIGCLIMLITRKDTFSAIAFVALSAMWFITLYIQKN